MSRECGIDRRSQYPELSNIDHDEHDQPRLPHSRAAGLRSLLPFNGFEIGVHFSYVEAFLPLAQIAPSRTSTSITSSARGGGP